MNRDIGYRIKIMTPPYANPHPEDFDMYPEWACIRTGCIGESGIRFTLTDAKKSAASNSIKKQFYEIWKLYIGDDPTKYFPPERVWP